MWPTGWTLSYLLLSSTFLPNQLLVKWLPFLIINYDNEVYNNIRKEHLEKKALQELNTKQYIILKNGTLELNSSARGIIHSTLPREYTDKFLIRLMR